MKMMRSNFQILSLKGISQTIQLMIMVLFFTINSCTRTSAVQSDSGSNADHQADNLIQNSLYAKTLFEIDVTSFFTKNEVLDFLREGDNYSMGLYAPLSFSVDSEKIYLPNRESNSIFCYTMNGLLARKINFDTLRLDYIDLLPSGNWVISSWGGRVFEATSGGVVVWSNVGDFNQDLFSIASASNNIVYRTKDGFNDKKGYFKDNAIVDLFDVVFDYTFVNDSTVALTYVDKSNMSLSISFVSSERSSFEIASSPRFNFEDIFGLKILKISHDRIKLAAVSDNQNDPISILEIDVEARKIMKISKVYLANDNVKFIGEGALLWPNGWVLKYANNRLYILYTTEENISVSTVSGI